MDVHRNATDVDIKLAYRRLALVSVLLHHPFLCIQEVNLDDDDDDDGGGNSLLFMPWQEWHPDKNRHREAEATAVFQEIQAAYAV